MSELGVIVRVALLILTGWLANAGHDPELVQFLRYDPEVLAAVTGAMWAVWYGLARWLGWKR
jgi:hypothetical protein